MSFPSPGGAICLVPAGSSPSCVPEPTGQGDGNTLSPAEYRRLLRLAVSNARRQRVFELLRDAGHRICPGCEMPVEDTLDAGTPGCKTCVKRRLRWREGATPQLYVVESQTPRPRRAPRPVAPPKPPRRTKQHGTEYAYRQGCRCDECRTARTAIEMARRARKKAAA